MSEISSLELNHRLKSFIMIGAAFADDAVNGVARRENLQKLLQLPLWVVAACATFKSSKLGVGLTCDELASRVKSSIQIQSANHGFECVGQIGRPHSATASLLAFTEIEEFS